MYVSACVCVSEEEEEEEEEKKLLGHPGAATRREDAT